MLAKTAARANRDGSGPSLELDKHLTALHGVADIGVALVILPGAEGGLGSSRLVFTAPFTRTGAQPGDLLLRGAEGLL
jgi:hypothetical protein